MKKWLVTWIDNNGAFRNGIFYANNIFELRDQTENLGRITEIKNIKEE